MCIFFVHCCMLYTQTERRSSNVWRLLLHDIDCLTMGWAQTINTKIETEIPTSVRACSVHSSRYIYTFIIYQSREYTHNNYLINNPVRRNLMILQWIARAFVILFRFVLLFCVCKFSVFQLIHLSSINPFFSSHLNTVCAFVSFEISRYTYIWIYNICEQAKLKTEHPFIGEWKEQKVTQKN